MITNQNITSTNIDIKPGFYTIVYPNGEHRTLRVKMPKNGYFAGKLIIGFLTGSDNTSDYTYFGTIHNGQLMFWGKFSSKTPNIRLARIRRAVLIINGDQAETGKAYALNSGRCYVCNRLLTHPESILSGIGPECSKKEGY